MREDDGVALHIVDELDVDMVQRTIYVEPRAFGSSEDLLADTLVHVPPICVFRCPRKHCMCPLLTISLRSCRLSSSNARLHSVRLYFCTGRADASCAFRRRPDRLSGDRSR